MSREMKKVGFRMPANKIAMDLIKRAGTPVYAPSANISGGRPPTCAAEVLKSFAGEIDVILNGGRTEMGIESTVIDLTVDPPKVLREGAIKEAELTFTQV
jgi:L-threonylcarbamoyladenylate synthase